LSTSSKPSSTAPKNLPIGAMQTQFGLRSWQSAPSLLCDVPLAPHQPSNIPSLFCFQVTWIRILL
jgi:hypothetical protein